MAPQAPTCLLPFVRAPSALGVTDVLVRDQEEGHLPFLILDGYHIQQTPEREPWAQRQTQSSPHSPPALPKATGSADTHGETQQDPGRAAAACSI